MSIKMKMKMKTRSSRSRRSRREARAKATRASGGGDESGGGKKNPRRSDGRPAARLRGGAGGEIYIYIHEGAKSQEPKVKRMSQSQEPGERARCRG